MIDNLIPNSWVIHKLGEVCDVITGNTPSKSDASNFGNEIPFIKPPNLQHNLVGKTEEMLSTKGGNKSRLVPQNSVLVTCIGNLGRTGLTRQLSAFNQQINAIIENEALLGKFIFYQAQSPSFKLQLESLSAATTVAIVNKGKFETIKISIPPLAEQHRIVEKIEELFSELDKGIETLKTAQQQLKVYRQAVLKYAFEGKLTNPNVEEGELPEGWIIEISSKILDVRDGTHDTPKYVETGVPLVTSKNLKKGLIDLTKVSYISLEDHFEISKRSAVEFGDVLFAMIGTIGNPVVVKGDVQFSIKNVGLFKKNPTVILPEYLCHYLSSKVFEKQLEDRQLLKGTTQKFIPLGHLRQLLIPIPPIETQHKVLEELESRLSLYDKIDESIDQGLQQAEVLRQSILKKAFEGKLVPQDQNDEPASVLLERIKAERAAAQPEKKRKTKKVKA